MNFGYGNDIGYTTEFGLLCKLVIDELAKCTNPFTLALKLDEYHRRIAELGHIHNPQQSIDVDCKHTYPIRVDMREVDGGCSVGTYFRLPINQAQKAATLGDFLVDEDGVMTSHNVRQTAIDEIFTTLEAWQRLDAIRKSDESLNAEVMLVEDSLNGNSLKLFRFLKTRKHKTHYDTLRGTCEKEISDAGIKRALERLAKDLTDTQFILKIEHASKRVLLEDFEPN